jgi:hypothetical protein
MNWRKTAVKNDFAGITDGGPRGFLLQRRPEAVYRRMKFMLCYNIGTVFYCSRRSGELFQGTA